MATIHAQGGHAICYFSAGTYENWRADAGKFPASVLGSSNGWPGEKWLDIRNLSVLGPIMSARMDKCKAAGFDAIDPDNVDGYSNSSGFPLSASDQITFNTWLANQAHARGLAAFLKNDGDQIGTLKASFDGAIEEQCQQYGECSIYSPFVSAGKPVFGVEYKSTCPSSSLMFNALLKHLALDAYRVKC